MGFADGFYYGQGKIICDTANLLQGDTIRVRSLTDVSKVWNKTVVTVGTPVVFDVPSKDYYKICLVQEINNAEVEIGGVNKTVDYGQTFYIDVLDKTSFGGIKGILNAGQATTQLQIGDEVHTLVEGVDWVMQVADISASRVTLVSKYLWKASQYSNATKTYYSDSSPIHDEVVSFLDKLPQKDQDCIATITKPQHTPTYQTSSWSTFSDKIWLPNTWEVLGNSGSIGNYYGTPPIALTQFALFTTQANRIRTLASGGTAYAWWCCDGNAQAYGGEAYQVVTDLGASASANRTVSDYILPCCAIEADS